MNTRRESRERVNWLLLEGVVVVFSILLAFWIDAAWNERQVRQLEHAYLLAMREDVLKTIEETDRIRDRQFNLVEDARATVDLITAGANLPEDIRTSFIPVVLPAESMDTYRDLVASGNTTIISNSEVRAAMAHLTQIIEYNDRAEKWALELVTSLRVIVLGSEPDAISRQRLAEIWTSYVDGGERVLDGKNRMRESALKALAALDQEIDGAGM